MKKILSFVLVLAMVLGSVAFVSAADLTDLEGKPYETAATVLADLGVINGYADKTFKGENGINRAEFVTMIIQALGFNPQKGGAQKFEDVDPNKWYGPYVAYAADLGIVYGKTATTFGPTDPVTLDQAIAFTTRALGFYDESVVKSVNRALGLGILKGVPTGGVAATRGQVAQLVYNAAAQEVGTVDKNGAWVSNYETSAWTKHDTFFTRNGATVAAAATVVKLADSDKVNLINEIGKKAKLVQKDGATIGIADVETTTLTGVYTAASNTLAGYTLGVAATPLNQFNNTDSIAPTALVNGTTYTAEAVVSGKTITELTSVIAWTAPTVYGANPAGADIATFVGAASGNWELDLNQAIDTNRFVIEGVDSLADIKQADAVVYAYADAAGKVRKVEVGHEIVSGTVTKLSSDNATITVAGKAYANLDAGVNATFVGKEVNMMLDYYGKAKVVALKTAATAATNYAVLLDSSEQSALDGGTKVQLKIADNSVKVFQVAAAAKATIDAYLPATPLTLVEYTLNANGEIATLVTATLTATANAADTKIVSNAIDGNLLGDAVLVVKDTALANGENFTKTFAAAANVSFGTKEDLVAGNYKVAYVVSATTGKITAVLLKANATVAANVAYGVYNGYATVADKTSPIENYFLVNGAAATYKSAATLGLGAVDGNLYCLTFNTNGTIAAATAVATGTPTAATKTVAAAAVTTKSANVLTDGTSNFAINNPTVYKAGTSTYAASTVSALIAAGATPTLFDLDGDLVYDVILY